MRMTAAGYRHVIGSLTSLARRHGDIAFTSEGGYELTALAECITATIAAIGDPEAASAVQFQGPTARGERAATAALAALKPYWRGL